MYDRIYRTFTKGTRWLSIVLLTGLAIEPIGQLIGLGTHTGVTIMTAILAAGVLLEPRLARLMMDEAWKEALGADLEKATDDLYRQEKERRRREGKWH